MYEVRVQVGVRHRGGLDEMKGRWSWLHKSIVAGLREPWALGARGVGAAARAHTSAGRGHCSVPCKRKGVQTLRE